MLVVQMPDQRGQVFQVSTHPRLCLLGFLAGAKGVGDISANAKRFHSPPKRFAMRVTVANSESAPNGWQFPRL